MMLHQKQTVLTQKLSKKSAKRKRNPAKNVTITTRMGQTTRYQYSICQSSSMWQRRPRRNSGMVITCILSKLLRNIFIYIITANVLTHDHVNTASSVKICSE